MYRNNNKVFAPFQFKSPDKQQNLISEQTPQEKDTPPMRRKKWPLLVILLIFLIGAVCIFPWRSRVDLTLDAVHISPDGNVIAQGEVILRGYSYNYLFRQDTFKLTALQLPDHEIGQIIDRDNPILQTYIGLYRTHMWVELPEYTSENNWYTGQIIFPDDKSWIVIQLTDWIYICPPQENGDYAGILDESGPLL